MLEDVSLHLFIDLETEGNVLEPLLNPFSSFYSRDTLLGCEFNALIYRDDYGMINLNLLSLFYSITNVEYLEILDTRVDVAIWSLASRGRTLKPPIDPRINGIAICKDEDTLSGVEKRFLTNSSSMVEAKASKEISIDSLQDFEL